MLANPLVTILWFYGAIMCGAMTLIIWAFRGRIDLSGHLFLLSEALRLPVIIGIILVHTHPDFRNSATYLIINVLYWQSDAFFVLSLYALANGKGFKHAVLVCSILLVFCLTVEVVRIYDPTLPYVLHSITGAIICFTGTYVCRGQLQGSSSESSFWRVLKYIESAFGFVSLLRIVLFFFVEGFTPLQATKINLSILAFVLFILIFRFVAYLAIWMTWSRPNISENTFNQNLLKTLRERDRLLQKLSVSNRRIGVGALASSIAHELGQPLTSAALQAETAKRYLIEGSTKENAINAIDRISRQLKTMAAIVSSLRGLFGESSNKLRPTPLVPLCDEIIDLIQFSSGDRGVAFIKDYKASPIFMGDAIQIQQVLINIIENAIQDLHTVNEKNPTITITIQQMTRSAIISIKDNGRGIQPDSLSRVFELYETSRRDGVGVGLWLCKQIVERHLGQISAANIPTAGALFKIELPLAGST